MSFQDKKRRRQPGRILLCAYPFAKYLAVLLISLNLQRLPAQTWLFPGRTAPRAVFMLWTALLLCLSGLMDSHAAKERLRDLEAQASHPSGQMLNLISFLAVAVPFLFLLDAAAIAHFYLSWYHSASSVLLPVSPVPTLIMAAGCVFIIYGRALPTLPLGSHWGIKTARTTVSAEAWSSIHRKAGSVLCISGFLCLALGTFI